MRAYSTTAFALLCATPVAIVSCAPHTAQDSIEEEIALISAALDIFEETTEDNAAEMLSKLEQLDAKREKMFELRKTLPAEEVKSTYYSEKNIERLGALNERLDEVGPAFSMRLFQAKDTDLMKQIADKVQRYCANLPRRTAPIQRNH